MEQQQCRRTQRRQRWVRYQGSAHAHYCSERADRVPGVLALLLELCAPPPEGDFRCNTTTLCEPEEMDAVRRPGALRREVCEYAIEELECGCRVRPLDQLTKRVEGRVPLEGLFV